MLKDEIQAHLLGLKARETVLERFSMEKVAEEYLELYRRLTPLA
jgi:glycosyltransferase involved in cell wall biosynthesis